MFSVRQTFKSADSLSPLVNMIDIQFILHIYECKFKCSIKKAAEGSGRAAAEHTKPKGILTVPRNNDLLKSARSIIMWVPLSNRNL